MTFTHTLSTLQLQALRGAIIFDCRHDLAQPARGAAQYAEHHISGAFFAGLDSHLSGEKTGHNGRHPLPDRSTFIAWLAQCGVQLNTQIICYDALDGMFAARLWWLCRWAGVQNVAVLAGGYAAWQASDGAVSREQPTAQAKAPWDVPALEKTLTAGALLAQLHSPTQLLLDARAPERYRGEVEPMDPVAGHIPGAQNRFFKRNVTPQGDFASDLSQQWQQALGTFAPTQLVHTCGSGATACHNILALHVAGLLKPHEASTLYAGSWSEWCADAARPVAKG